MPFDLKAVGKNLISIGDKEIVTGQKLDSAAPKTWASRRAAEGKGSSRQIHGVD
jgi:hypothetical protein